MAEDAEIIRQEIFGPVAVINRFESEEEVIKLANDTHYGLMAGIFAQDITRAMRVSTELDSGMVGIDAVSTVFW
ncbi:Aldehyde dehydrogenase [Fusarium austroafricanum]|uniref:Aldehyde dehydrogenase n=1 Tax=Fusarium austroafricanum TaxID=2364996 RepID=A0A8H4KS02_9HYPO|nr:Aldehyde dehydrogenase [Fusarium austroafricanum]